MLKAKCGRNHCAVAARRTTNLRNWTFFLMPRPTGFGGADGELNYFPRCFFSQWNAKRPRCSPATQAGPARRALIFHAQCTQSRVGVVLCRRQLRLQRIIQLFS